MLTAKTLPIAALGVLFCQCAGGPALDRRLTVTKAKATLVAYQNIDDALSLSTVNQSAMTAENARAARAKDAGLKVIPDSEVQLLADMLGGLGFFELAESQRNPEAEAWIVLQHDGREDFTTNIRRSKEEAAQFKQCMDAFFAIYNANDNFMGSKMNAADLKRAGREVNTTSRSVLDGKQRKNRNP